MGVIRFVVLALCVLATAVIFLSRMNLNIAIVAMSQEVCSSEKRVYYCSAAGDDLEVPDENSTCPCASGSMGTAEQYDWNEPTQVNCELYSNLANCGFRESSWAHSSTRTSS